MDYNAYVIIPNENITPIYGKTKYVSIICRHPGDTRPEFKMWGGVSKSVFVLESKNLSTSI